MSILYVNGGDGAVSGCISIVVMVLLVSLSFNCGGATAGEIVFKLWWCSGTAGQVVIKLVVQCCCR
jgi:hypothetical protein